MESDAVRAGHAAPPNGGGVAAVMAAGIGALAMGLLVIANEAGIFTAPTLYGPTGGLSGRSTFAVVTWLAAWGILHARWRDRTIASSRVLTWAIVMIGLGVLLTFPPVWRLL